MEHGRLKNPIPVSVIISTYNDATTLDACIDTILDLNYPCYEVVFVDDGSSDNTAAIFRERAKGDSRIRFISCEQNQGVPVARNIGMKNARGDIFVFTDGDCTFEKDWLSKLVAPLLSDPQIGCSGGLDRLRDDEPLLSRCIDYTMRSLIATGGVRGGSVRLSKYSPTGCNFAVRRDVINEVGMHNEQLRHRGEEKELEYRIRRAGYRIVYVKDAFVWHKRKSSLGAFWRQTFLSGKARIDILTVAPGAVEPAHLFPLAFVLAVFIGTGLALFPTMRFLWLGAAGGYALLMLVQAFTGVLHLKDWRAFYILPITTMIIHFGYGLGSLWRIVENILGKNRLTVRSNG